MLGFHLVEHGFIRMAQIDEKKHLARHHIARIGLHFHQADGSYRIRVWAIATACTASTMRDAPSRAFFRKYIGVAPVWADWP